MIVYDDGRVVLYEGDSRELLDDAILNPANERRIALVTDPPYGINHASGQNGRLQGRGIEGDQDTALRDWALACVGQVTPAIIFGTWKRPKPEHTRAVVVWDKGMGVGMGDLELPWKPNWEEIYICGGRHGGFVGPRDDGVLKGHVMVSWSGLHSNRSRHTGIRRDHPHQKPADLMMRLLLRIDPAYTIIDPFAGVGTTLVAGKALGRRAIGIEIDPEWTALAKLALAQDNLLTPEPAHEPLELVQ